MITLPTLIHRQTQKPKLIALRPAYVRENFSVTNLLGSLSGGRGNRKYTLLEELQSSPRLLRRLPRLVNRIKVFRKIKVNKTKVNRTHEIVHEWKEEAENEQAKQRSCDGAAWNWVEHLLLIES